MKQTKEHTWAKSLKNLRAIIGATQEDLAELVGVATITIKVAEARGGKVTRKLGTQIQMATGAIIGLSAPTADGLGPYEPLAGNMVISKWTGYGPVAFSLAKFNKHRKEDEAARIEPMVKTLTMLCKAASQFKSAKLHGLRWSFMEWAREAIERFNLEVPSPMESALPVRPLRGASKSSTRPRTRRG